MSMNKQAGFGMAELMVATAIAGSVIAFAIALTSRAKSDQVAHVVADDFTSFQNAAAQYFSANRTAMTAAMTGGTNASNFCQVNVASSGAGTLVNSVTLHTCAMDASQLKYANALPPGVASTNAYGQKWVAIFRAIYDSAGTTPTGSVDMLTVAVDDNAPTSGVDKRRWDQVTEAAATAGGNMGVIPDGNRGSCKAERSTNTFKACGNGWSVDLSQFINATQLATFANALPN
jgi:type II secretory pathway pseudopilin PulG